MIKALEQEAVQYNNARKTVLVIFGLLALFASILIGIWALISL